MGPEELNEILLHTVPNSWAQQVYLQGWYSKGRTYNDTCNNLERMEIVKAIYKGGAPSKNTQRAEANRDSSGRKEKGGASASPSKPDQVHSGKRKRSNTGHPSNEPTGANKTCLIHGPGHSSEECKILQEYIESLLAQHTYKDKQALSRGNKRGKTFKFEGFSEEANVTKSHDDPTP